MNGFSLQKAGNNRGPDLTKEKSLKNYQNRRLPTFFPTLLLCLLFGLTTVAAAEKNKTTIAESGKNEEKKNLATFTHYETEFSKDLVDLTDKIGGLIDPDEHQEELAEIAKNIDQLAWQIEMVKTDLNMSLEQIAIFEIKLQRRELTLKKIATPLNLSIQQLSDWEVQWSDKKRELAEWEKNIPPESTFALVLKNIAELNRTTAGALKFIRGKLRPAITTEQKVSKLLVKIYALSVKVEGLITERKQSGFEQTMPSLFSPQFFQFLNLKLLQSTLDGIKRLNAEVVKYFTDHLVFFLLNFLGFILLATTIKRSGRHLTHAEKWYYFSRKPLSVALLFLLLFYLVFRPALFDTLINMERILQIVFSITVIFLATVFTSYSPREIWFIRSFALILAITWLGKIVTLPAPLMQLLVASLSLGVVCYCLWRIRDLQKKKKSKLRTLGLRLLTIPFAVICIGTALGYQQFFLYFFTSLLISLVAALVVIICYLITVAILELMLSQIPYKLFQENSSAIVNSLIPIVGFMSGFFYLSIILIELQIYPTRQDAFQGLLSLRFTWGGMNISPDIILLTVATVYVVYMISKAIQKVLLDSILPRYRVELGVQLSMVRLTHYSILVIGFIILLNILGFELTKLTILGGALGVGIGFGLQAIVNNFVSGLILLFERPIKVGDTVEIGDDLGEVKKLGLRATVVSTFDNAEIVIPNSDLITAPVTNWTLSGRQARVKVPVGVAYGSDIQKVFEILMTCADEHPQVLSKPQASALFLAFGASSLDFELRVWVPDFTDRMQVLSDLNQEIESEFSLAKIEIPFPQTDLHLRSVDEQVTSTFNGRVMQHTQSCK